MLPKEKMNFDLAEPGGERRPTDVKHLFNDTGSKPAYLVTYPNGTTPRDRHMAIRWTVNALPHFFSAGFPKAARTLELCENLHPVEPCGQYLLSPLPRSRI